MCGQIAYVWNTMPRLRDSAATSISFEASKKIALPQPIRP
jgi:hypothetical protein